MKNCLRFVPLIALASTLFATSASAAIITPLGPNSASINFIALTEETAANGGLGESAWSTLSIPSFFGMQITGHATNDNDTAQFAYLDKGTAGLGSCKDSSSANVATPGSGANRCDPGSDDNVTDHEYLEFTFDEDVVVDNLWFNNNHNGGFGTNPDGSEDMVTIGVGLQGAALTDPGGVFPGTAFEVALGYTDGVNGIGSFKVAKGDRLWVAFNNEQFYLSGMAVSAVPVPAAVWLFGTALLGFIGYGRRTSVS